MNNDRELLEQALEDAYLAGFNASGEGYNGEYPFQDKNRLPTNDENWLRNRAEDLAPLRERLAQPQRTHWEGCEEVHPECRKPEQEPVAWVTGWHDGHCVIRAANPAAILPIGIALYTTPPRREWVGLTEGCIDALAEAAGTRDVAGITYFTGRKLIRDFARAIEAKLKEKNT